MKFFSIALLFVSSIAALPTTNPLAERQSSIILTEGPGGSVLPRYEVRELKDKFIYQWTLFILGMMVRSNHDLQS